jgi:hypothetical protein
MARRETEIVSHGESLFLYVGDLRDRTNTAVADAAPGLTFWFSVAKVTAGQGSSPPTVETAAFENLIDFSGYLAASGIVFEAITETQSLAATLPDLSGGDWYKGLLRMADASGNQDLRRYEIKVTHEASILTSAPP